MRTASPALVSFLLSKQPYLKADLFTFTFQGGSQLLVTSFDYPVIYGLLEWVAVGPLVQRSKWSVKNTIEVPTLEVNLFSNGEDYNGQNIKLLIHQGLFDGCNLLLQRAFMPALGDTSLGLVTLFGGRAGPVELTARGAKITFKGSNVLMEQFMPRNRYELGCIHALYDAGCTLNRVSFTSANTVGVGSDTNTIVWGTSPANAVNYTKGYVTFTSGSSNGQRRTISSSDGTSFSMAYPLFSTPVAGDTMNVTFGCDKTRDGGQGCAFFSNQQNFRGFKNIPPAETGL